jgi:hypothetical protein
MGCGAFFFQAIFFYFYNQEIEKILVLLVQI